MNFGAMMKIFWYWISNLGIAIPFISYAFCYLINAILTIKIKRNKYTCFLPLLAGIIGIILAVPDNVFLPEFRLWQTKAVLGFFLGISATGLHQLKKRIKMYMQIRKLEKSEQKVKNIELPE